MARGSIDYLSKEVLGCQVPAYFPIEIYVTISYREHLQCFF